MPGTSKTVCEFRTWLGGYVAMADASLSTAASHLSRVEEYAKLLTCLCPACKKKHARKKQAPQQQATGVRIGAVPTPDWAIRCANHLMAHVREVPGGMVGANAEKHWGREIHLMVNECESLKKLSVTDCQDLIVAGIDWLFSPANTDEGQYQFVVRSGSALREKWPRICAKADKESQKQLGTVGLKRWMESSS